MDSATRAGITAPPDGLMVFQTNGRKGFWYAVGGAWVYIPDKTKSGDNLGSHTATQNLNLGSNALTGAGNNLGTSIGIGVRNDGGLNIGQNTIGNNIYVGYQSGASNTTGAGNTALGVWSGNKNTTGANNTFTGSGSGRYNTTGNSNTFYGCRSGESNTVGINNNFFGAYSGLSNTTGANNLFVGGFSGQANTVADNNTFVGNVTGIANTSGVSNTFVGTYSGQANIAGDRNTFVGFGSGIFNTTGARNVALGSDAGPTSSNLNNTAAIGYMAKVSRSNSLVLGDTAAANAVNVGIGTAAPQTKLHVVGTTRTTHLQITSGAGSGRVLTSDASGNATWQPLLADNLGNHTASQALNLQSNALVGSGSDLGSAVGIGVRADGGLNIGQNAIGFNVCVGYLSGENNLSGLGNCFIGVGSGQSNIGGTENSFFGYRSGTGNTTGNQNVFVGAYAGNSNISGSNNAFVGYGVGNQLTSSGFNTFIGNLSGENTTTGAGGNTFVGYWSGRNNTTGSNNVAIGRNAGPTTGGLINTTAIGFQAKVSRSHSLVLGDTAASVLINVGIGTAAPQTRLHVVGTTRTTNLQVTSGAASGRVLTSDASGNATWQAVPSSADNLGNHTATQNLNLGANLLTGGGTSGLRVTSGGLVGIGTTTPAARLTVAGAEATTHGKNAAILLHNTSASTANTWNLRAGGNGTATPDGGFSIGDDGAYRFTITNTGRVGIGTTAPAEMLEVAGNARLQGLSGTGERLLVADAQGDVQPARHYSYSRTGLTAASTQTQTYNHNLGYQPVWILSIESGETNPSIMASYENTSNNQTIFRVYNAGVGAKAYTLHAIPVW